MQWIHLQLCGILIIDAYMLDITSANTFMREREFQNFSLYSFTTQGESWQRAYDACYSKGLQLAVLDKQDQDLLDTWEGLKKENGGHAWIAGRRLEDSGWMWVNGDLLTGTSFSEETSRMCGIIQGGLLKPTRCVVKRDDQKRRALCQTQNGGGSSYKLTSATFTSWFAARLECRSQQGRDLAHARCGQSDEEFLRAPDIANMTAEDSSSGVWVGVCQNCWSWVIDNQTSHQPMDYFHFGRLQGSGDGEDCLHLMLGGVRRRFRWSDKACNVSSKYFLCEQRNNTEDNRNSDPQTTPDTVVGCPSTTPEADSIRVLLPAILVPSVVVVVLVIVVTVLVIRKRQNTRRSGSKSRNPRDPSPPTHGGAEVVSPQNQGFEGPRSLHDKTADLQYPGPQLAASNGDYSYLRRSQVQVQDVEPYARLEAATMFERLGPRGQPVSEGERYAATGQARRPLVDTGLEDGTGPYVNVLGDTGAGTGPYVNVLGDTGAGTGPYVNVSGPQTIASICDNGGRPMEQRDYYSLS